MSRFTSKTNPGCKGLVCPLCSGEMTRSEGDTRLCSCGFHICHWCLSKIIQTSSSCPHCGKPYSSHVLRLLESSSEWQSDDNTSSSSAEQEKRRNNRVGKQQSSPHGDLHYLQSVRIIQRCLVYVIGLAPSLANEATLRSTSMFGQYGKIKKIIMNNTPQLIEKVHSCCAHDLVRPLTRSYITFSSPKEALLCIMACDGCVLRGSQIRLVLAAQLRVSASFGTTKYCNFFLRGIRCTNADCMYLHAMAEEADCFTKKEMQTRQAEFYAKTHPCHSEMATVPMGEEVSCLPPAGKALSTAGSERCEEERSLPAAKTLATADASCASLRMTAGIPSVFGDVHPICEPRDSLNAPLECSKVPASSWECLEGLKSLGREGVACLPVEDESAVDVGFLLGVEECLMRIHQRNSATREEWNWRSASRSYSIDSNTQIEG